VFFEMTAGLVRHSMQARATLART